MEPRWGGSWNWAVGTPTEIVLHKVAEAENDSR
jgi:hypothetical protein